MKILIAGASGNIGQQLVRELLEKSRHRLVLLQHRSPLPESIRKNARVEIRQGDLDDVAWLKNACRGVNQIVYSAGVLFKPFPGSFLERTNYLFVRNMVDAALATGVQRFILASFPHVEGETTPERPATGRLDVTANALHSATRLKAEKYLVSATKGRRLKALILRAGFIYGPELRLITGARWLLRHRVLAVWPQPTWVHLLAMDDYLGMIRRSLGRPRLLGIINLCDEQPIFLQDLLDQLADHWGYARPPRLPAFLFKAVAHVTELLTWMLGLPCPLHPDVIKMGMTSSVADTRRMKKEFGRLRYPTLAQGIRTL